MTLDELIKRLEEIKAEYSGELPLCGRYTEREDEYSLDWKSLDSFVQVKGVGDASKMRVVIG